MEIMIAVGIGAWFILVGAASTWAVWKDYKKISAENKEEV